MGLQAPAYEDRTAREVLGSRWREQGAEALINPRRIAAPFADHGTFLAHEAAGAAYAFGGLEGQTLEIELARAAVTGSRYDDGPIFIDLYRVERRGRARRLRPVEEIRLAPGRLRVTLTRTGEYVLSIRPDLLVNAYFGLRLELLPALVFPVQDRTLEAVRSHFGDPRDGGERRHEGVDIFAPRSTPIVAVAAGRAVPRRNNLGGNVVYLNTNGVSYYYAHLERAAMQGPRRVEAGDVLGFVGTSGNAAATPPHLHFGIYDWGGGRGAVDPMPYLIAHRFGDDSGAVGDSDTGDFGDFGDSSDSGDSGDSGRSPVLPAGETPAQYGLWLEGSQIVWASRSGGVEPLVSPGAGDRPNGLDGRPIIPALANSKVRDARDARDAPAPVRDAAAPVIDAPEPVIAAIEWQPALSGGSSRRFAWQ